MGKPSVGALALVVLSAALASGCAAFRGTGESLKELFGFSTPTVLAVGPLGPYQEALLKSGRSETRVVFPQSQACAAVLEPEAKLSYHKSGVFGSYSRGDQTCTAVGTLSLAAWRDRIARPTVRLAPRGTARYRLVWQDEYWLLLRGRFPLLNLMGVPSYDLVVMVPNGAACRDAAERGEAAIEYHSSGSHPYALISRGKRCLISGFALPPDATKAPPATNTP